MIILCVIKILKYISNILEFLYVICLVGEHESAHTILNLEYIVVDRIYGLIKLEAAVL